MKPTKPSDQYNTIFSIENIKFSINEISNLLKTNVNYLGSQALLIRKTEAYKYNNLNFKTTKSIHPLEYLTILIPLFAIFYLSIRAGFNSSSNSEKKRIYNMIKLYNDSFIIMKENINNILNSPDSHKINKEDINELYKLLKSSEVMHAVSNKLLSDKHIITCYVNTKNNKINKNSDNVCRESIKFEEIEAQVNTIVEQLGSMVLAKSDNNLTKINSYIDSIIKLKQCIAYNYHHSKFYNKNKLQIFYEDISFLLCIANVLLEKDHSQYYQADTYSSRKSKYSSRKSKYSSRKSTSSSRKSTSSSRKSKSSYDSKKTKKNNLY